MNEWMSVCMCGCHAHIYHKRPSFIDSAVLQASFTERTRQTTHRP